MRKLTIAFISFIFLALSVVALQEHEQHKKKPPAPPPVPGPTGITPQIVMSTTYTNSTPTPSDTPLSFAGLSGGTSYTLTCALYFSGTVRVMLIDLTGPPNPATLGYSFDHALVGALAGGQNNTANAFGTQLGVSNNVPTPNQRFNSVLTMGLVTGTSGGTLTVQAAAPAGTVTIYPGSFCRLQ